MTRPPGSGELVVMSRTPLIVREKDLVVVSPWLSLACMLNVEVPAVMGVPPIRPVAEFNAKPAGKAPPVSAQV